MSPPPSCVSAFQVFSPLFFFSSRLYCLSLSRGRQNQIRRHFQGGFVKTEDAVAKLQSRFQDRHVVADMRSFPECNPIIGLT